MRPLRHSEVLALQALDQLGIWAYPRQVEKVAFSLKKMSRSSIGTALARLVLKGLVDRHSASQKHELYRINRNGRSRLETTYEGEHRRSR